MADQLSLSMRPAGHRISYTRQATICLFSSADDDTTALIEVHIIDKPDRDPTAPIGAHTEAKANTVAGERHQVELGHSVSKTRPPISLSAAQRIVRIDVLYHTGIGTPIVIESQ